jgi:hypothetical protein
VYVGLRRRTFSKTAQTRSVVDEEHDTTTGKFLSPDDRSKKNGNRLQGEDLCLSGKKTLLEKGVGLAHEPFRRFSTSEKSTQAPWTLCVRINQNHGRIDLSEKDEPRDETLKSMFPPPKWFTNFKRELPCSTEKKIVQTSKSGSRNVTPDGPRCEAESTD